MGAQPDTLTSTREVWHGRPTNSGSGLCRSTFGNPLSSTLSILRCSCGVAEGVRNAVPQTPREFLHARDFAGDRETLCLPDLAPHGGQRIGKGRLLLVIPSCRPDRAAGARCKL